MQLCLWAGADPHAKVPDLHSLLYYRSVDEDEGYSAVEEACSNGHDEILRRLRPDPAVDDFEELYRRAANERVVGVLAEEALPRDGSAVIEWQLSRLVWSGRVSTGTLRALFTLGVRWEVSSKAEIAQTRRDLLVLGNWRFEEVMKLLGSGDHCSSEVLVELARTPTMRARMKALGLIPSSPYERSGFNRSRPSEAKAILAKFGIEVPRNKVRDQGAPLDRVARIGAWSATGEKLRLSRAELLERVWRTPVDTLAKEWGLSGRGLAKACRRLQVPVPPRGHWARLRAGKPARRPKLPELPSGQGEEIIVCLPPAPEGG